jgi:hypothetical protein
MWVSARQQQLINTQAHTPVSTNKNVDIQSESSIDVFFSKRQAGRQAGRHR